MKILVVGSGGREHALVTKIRESPDCRELFVAPGNPGMEGEATCVPIDASEVVKQAQFAADMGIDLVVVGPEGPLFLGIADLLAQKGIPAVAPSQAAAEIEGSKIFAKAFMGRHGIPTAPSRVAESAEQALAFVDEPSQAFPLVVKADGLAAGKGVVIAQDRDEARAAIDMMMVQRRFGSAGDRVLLEEHIDGEEVSVFVLTDGRSFQALVPAQDHKRLLDGDRGPNTGGMGAYSPVPGLAPERYKQILETVVVPTISGLHEEGRPFVGALFAGIMLTKEGPKVLEFNARLGDPEAQTVLARLESDIVPIFRALALGKLHEMQLSWRHEAAVTVVLASEGYPLEPKGGKLIRGLELAATLPGVTIAHAGTKRTEEGFITAGGRVLAVTALAPGLADAIARAYEACDCIEFEGKVLRRDVGRLGLQHLGPPREVI